MSLSKLFELHFSEILSFTSIIVGVFLGWLLTTISKKGKLKIIDIKIDQEIHLWFYNSSDNIKSISNIKINIWKHGNETKIDWSPPKEKKYHYNFNPKQITEISSELTIDNPDICRITVTYKEVKKGKKRFTIYQNNLETYLYSGIWARVKTYLVGRFFSKS